MNALHCLENLYAVIPLLLLSQHTHRFCHYLKNKREIMRLRVNQSDQ